MRANRWRWKKSAPRPHARPTIACSAPVVTPENQQLTGARPKPEKPAHQIARRLISETPVPAFMPRSARPSTNLEGEPQTPLPRVASAPVLDSSTRSSPFAVLMQSLAEVAGIPLASTARDRPTLAPGRSVGAQPAAPHAPEPRVRPEQQVQPSGFAPEEGFAIGGK